LEPAIRQAGESVFTPWPGDTSPGATVQIQGRAAAGDRRPDDRRPSV